MGCIRNQWLAQACHTHQNSVKGSEQAKACGKEKKNAKDEQRSFFKSCVWSKNNTEGVGLRFGKFSAVFADDKDQGTMTLSVASASSNKRMLFKLRGAP